MKFSLFDIVLGSLLLLQVDAVIKKLMKEINICKRNTPDMTTCYCDNINQILPLLKDCQSEMGIPPLDPIQVDIINMILPATKNINVNARLYDVITHGISKNRAVGGKVYISKNGLQASIDLFFPEIALKSNFNASDRFLLPTIDSDGDFLGKFSDIMINSTWNSTKFTRNGKEYLKFTVGKMEVERKEMRIHFNNLFGNNTELNENINDAINSNIHLLYDEIKPVVMETIKTIMLNFANNFYNTFSYDVLFPVD